VHKVCLEFYFFLLNDIYFVEVIFLFVCVFSNYFLNLVQLVIQHAFANPEEDEAEQEANDHIEVVPEEVVRNV